MDLDRTLRSIATLVRQFVGNEIVGARVDYLAAYPCRVATQNSDGSLELQPDDTRLPPVTAPLRTGVPGLTVQVANGARVLLQWTGGDPTKPVATLWESATVTSLIFTAALIKLGASGANHPLIFGDDFTDGAGAFHALIAAIATAVGGIPGGSAAGTAITAALSTYHTAVAAKLSAISKTS